MTTTLIVLLIAGMLWCVSVGWVGLLFITAARLDHKRFDYILGSTVMAGAIIAFGVHIWKFLQATS